MLSDSRGFTGSRVCFCFVRTRYLTLDHRPLWIHRIFDTSRPPLVLLWQRDESFGCSWGRASETFKRTCFSEGQKVYFFTPSSAHGGKLCFCFYRSVTFARVTDSPQRKKRWFCGEKRCVWYYYSWPWRYLGRLPCIRRSALFPKH